MKSDGVRSRSVARDFKGNDKDRDDLFAATPPLEAKRLLISRAATRVNGRLTRKLLFIDAKKAHLNPVCKEDVYINLPDEAEGGGRACAVNLISGCMVLGQLPRPGKTITQRSSKKQDLREDVPAELSSTM
jgi:hypothetical protein